MTKRLPATRPLTEILPKGAEGGHELARIVDLLLFYTSRDGDSITLFDDSRGGGDFYGLDSFGQYQSIPTGFQYKNYSSPLSTRHRDQLKKAVMVTVDSRHESNIERFVLVTPNDFETRDIAWFKQLQERHAKALTLEHWGHKQLQALFLQAPSLCLLYYPELVPDGLVRRKSLAELRGRYDRAFDQQNRRIRFIGMSVYKQEAAKGVEMEHIYIPLSLVAENADERTGEPERLDPRGLLKPGARHVVLGDPGSGKSTLLRFLALLGQTPPLRKRFEAQEDDRLPVLVILRRYADQLKERPQLSLLEHLVETTSADFGFPVDASFFEFYLETGRAILCFDGLDELPSPHFKDTVRLRIENLLASYPGNSCIVTSRVVGYDGAIRFDERQFHHHRVARLQPPEIDQFVEDWYRAREEDRRLRQQMVADLHRVLHLQDHDALRELAANPLLLTIIALVHRIDAVLPDERVVLYEKCTETLLSSWHQWKHPSDEPRTRQNRTEQRNRRRMEAVAHWMHERATTEGKEQRSVVPREELRDHLASYIAASEQPGATDEARDLAEEFLEFVTERSGLLLEVGDSLFSFIHLTFQEYLASSYLLTCSEKEGVEGIWKRIVPLIEQDRWQETLRLLLASLRSWETRAEVVARTLDLAKIGPSKELISLLLGLLLDSVEEAEQQLSDIFREALRGIAHLRAHTEVHPLIHRLKAVLTKLQAADELSKQARSLLPEIIGTEQRSAILLTAVAATTDPEEFLVQVELDLEPERSLAWLRFFAFETIADDMRNEIEQGCDLLNTFGLMLAYSSPGGVAFASCFLGLGMVPPLHESSQKRLFRSSLGFLAQDRSSSFLYFFIYANAYSISAPLAPSQILDRVRNRTRERAHALHRALNRDRKWTWDRARTLARILDRARDSALERALNRALNLDRARALDNALDRTRALARALGRTLVVAETLDRILRPDQNQSWSPGRNLDQGLDGALNRALSLEQKDEDKPLPQRAIWQALFGLSEFRDSLLETVVSTFQLEPPAHWQAALEATLLPRMERYNFAELSIHELEGQLKTVSGQNLAGFLLLQDIWLRCYEENWDSPETSPVHPLAERARASDVPELRIATCLRDLAYGDTSREDDLAEMIQNPDPAMRELLVDCLVLPT